MTGHGHTVYQDASAHQEHRRGTHHGQQFHQLRCRRHEHLPHRLRHPTLALHQIQPDVIKLDDCRDESVDADRHRQRNCGEHCKLLHERRIGDDSEREQRLDDDREGQESLQAAGLPGEHHFYISFDTTMPGVQLSRRLREKYPEEMTVVLQHRFWDLLVNDERFEVKLSFDGAPERLVVPFAAIRVFYDPSVRFGLQFEAMDLTASEDGDATGPMGGDAVFGSGRKGRSPPARGNEKPRMVGERKPRAPRKPKGEPRGDDEAAEVSPSAVTAPVASRRQDKEAVAASAGEADLTEAVVESDEAAAPATETPGGGAEIVSLDHFRKKK